MRVPGVCIISTLKSFSGNHLLFLSAVIITILFLGWKRGRIGVPQGKNVTPLGFSQIAQELLLNCKNQAPDFRKFLFSTRMLFCRIVYLFRYLIFVKIRTKYFLSSAQITYKKTLLQVRRK